MKGFYSALKSMILEKSSKCTTFWIFNVPIIPSQCRYIITGVPAHQYLQLIGVVFKFFYLMTSKMNSEQKSKKPTRVAFLKR